MFCRNRTIINFQGSTTWTYTHILFQFITVFHKPDAFSAYHFPSSFILYFNYCSFYFILTYYYTIHVIITIIYLYKYFKDKSLTVNIIQHLDRPGIFIFTSTNLLQHFITHVIYSKSYTYFKYLDSAICGPQTIKSSRYTYILTPWKPTSN